MTENKYTRARRVAETIKKITSNEMIEYLKDKTAYEIYDLAMRHVKDSGKLEEFLIGQFPRRIKDL